MDWAPHALDPIRHSLACLCTVPEGAPWSSGPPRPQGLWGYCYTTGGCIFYHVSPLFAWSLDNFKIIFCSCTEHVCVGEALVPLALLRRTSVQAAATATLQGSDGIMWALGRKWAWDEEHSMTTYGKEPKPERLYQIPIVSNVNDQNTKLFASEEAENQDFLFVGGDPGYSIPSRRRRITSPYI